MRVKVLCLTLLLSLILIAPVAAQSGGYWVQADTAGAATGGTLTGATYRVQGTLGQPAVDTSAGARFAVTGGIWTGAAARAEVLVLAKEARSNNVVVKRAEAGAALTYILAATNNGVRAQAYVTVTDALPAGLALLPDSVESKWGTVQAVGAVGGAGAPQYRVTWTIPTLPPNEIAVLTYQAYPLTSTEGLTLTNTAVGVSASHGPVTATASIQVYRPQRLYLPLIVRGYPSVTPPPAPVVHPLADAPAQCLGAMPGVVGDIYQDDFGTANDNDWYQFAAEAGQTYQIATSALGARADTILTWYAAGDCVHPIAQNDDISYPSNIASQLVWTAPAGGMYYAMVRNWNWEVYGADTGYRFTVARTTAARQSAPAAPAMAKPTPPPTPAAGDGR